MKKLLVLIMITVLTWNCFSQSIGDNTIIVKNLNTDISGFNSIKKVLINSGYSIIKTDEEIGYILTDYKPFEGSTIAIEPLANITIMFDNNSIKLYSNYKFKGSQAFGGEYSGRADFQKRKNVGRRLAFDEMVKLSQKLGTNIEYKLE